MKGVTFMKNSTPVESSVRTLERGLEILQLFEKASADYSLTEIANQTDLSPSTASRLLASLEKFQFIRRDPGTRRYSLGSALLRLSDFAERQTDLRSIALPFLRDLQQKYNESTSIYVAQNNQRVCLERVESTQKLRRIIMIGESLSLTRGAGGRVLLAWMDKHERQLILSQDSSTTEAILKQVRDEGFAFSLAEREVGVFAVAAPIFNAQKKVIAALSMSGPVSRLNPDLQQEYIEAIQQTALQISKELGYQS